MNPSIDLANTNDNILTNLTIQSQGVSRFCGAQLL